MSLRQMGGGMVFCYQNCSSDREILLKFEAEGREFKTFLRSLEQFIHTVKGQNNFWYSIVRNKRRPYVY